MRLNRIASKLEEFAKLSALTTREAQLFGESRITVILRMLHMLVSHGFSIRELRAYPRHIKRYRDRYPALVSKERSLAGLARINDHTASELTEDKHRFYRHCYQHDIPTPQHIFSTRSGDETYDHWSRLDPEASYQALPRHFIVKDRQGAYGSGFRSFEKLDGHFHSQGESLTVSSLKTYFESENTPRLIVQERVFDTRKLSDLSGTNSLQTLRLVTHLSKDGEITLLYFVLKLLANGNEADNFSAGQSGNLIAYGDPRSGTLEAAVIGQAERLGLRTIDRHPDTGVFLEGFRVPHWERAIALVSSAHHSIEGLTAIGWDVALTDRGPLILEGNAWFDPPFHVPQLLTEANWRMLFVNH